MTEVSHNSQSFKTNAYQQVETFKSLTSDSDDNLPLNMLATGIARQITVLGSVTHGRFEMSLMHNDWYAWSDIIFDLFF